MWIAWLLIFPFFTWLVTITFLALHTGLHILVYRVLFRYPSDYTHECWNDLKLRIAKFGSLVATLMNGYEVVGFENLPDPKDSGALVVFHHGTMLLEFLHFMSQLALHKHMKFIVIGDRTLFRIPLLAEILKFIQILPGSYPEVVEWLKQGYCVILSPGGVYEAQFTNDYEVLWRNRKGFAKAAIEAKVPVIPLFTKNSKEAYRNVYFSKRFYHWLYEKTKIPVVPTFGGFPVKEKAYIGQPIPYDPTVTPEELANKAAEALKSLIRKHQRLPGSILMGILDRFVDDEKKK